MMSGWSGRRSSPASCGAEVPAAEPNAVLCHFQWKRWLRPRERVLTQLLWSHTARACVCLRASRRPRPRRQPRRRRRRRGDRAARNASSHPDPWEGGVGLPPCDPRAGSEACPRAPVEVVGRRAALEGGPPGSQGRPRGHTGSITQRDAVLMVGWKTTVAPTRPFASKYLPLQLCWMDFGLPDVVVHFWYAPPLQGNV